MALSFSKSWDTSSSDGIFFPTEIPTESKDSILQKKRKFPAPQVQVMTQRSCTSNSLVLVAVIRINMAHRRGLRGYGVQFIVVWGGFGFWGSDFWKAHAQSKGRRRSKCMVFLPQATNMVIFCSPDALRHSAQSSHGSNDGCAPHSVPLGEDDIRVY